MPPDRQSPTPMPPELGRAVQSLQQCASEVSAQLLTEYADAHDVFKKHQLQLFDHINQPTKRAIALAHIGFGQPKYSAQKLRTSSWKLTSDDLLNAFGPAALCSRSFVDTLADFAAAATATQDNTWEAALAALKATRDRRKKNPDHRMRVSLKRDWAPQDVKDTMESMKLGQRKRTSRPRKAKSQPPSKRQRHADRDTPAHRSDSDSDSDSEEVEVGRANASQEDTPLSDDDVGNMFGGDPDDDDEWEDTQDDKRLEDHENDQDEVEELKNTCGWPVGMDEDEDHEVEEPENSSRWPAGHGVLNTTSGRPAAHDDAGIVLAGHEGKSSLRPDNQSNTTLPGPSFQLKSQEHKPSVQPGTNPLFPAQQLAAVKPSLRAQQVLTLTRQSDTPSPPLLQDEDLALAMGQLHDGAWLGDTTLQTMKNLLCAPHLRILEIASPESDSWHEWAQLAQGRHRVRLGQTTVLAPVLDRRRNHWMLLHLDLKACRATMYDSLLSKTNLEPIARAVASTTGADWEASSWTFNVPADVPQQTNSHDCGIFVFVAAMYLALGERVPHHINPLLWRLVLRCTIRGSPPDEAEIDGLLGTRQEVPPAAPGVAESFISNYNGAKSAVQRLEKMLSDVDATFFIAKLLQTSSNGNDLNGSFSRARLDLENRQYIVNHFQDLFPVSTPHDGMMQTSIQASLEASHATVAKLESTKENHAGQQKWLKSLNRVVDGLRNITRDRVKQAQQELDDVKVQLQIVGQFVSSNDI